MKTLDDYIKNVRTLPPAPRILGNLFNLLRDDFVAPGRIVEVITFDPALTAKVLQRCNCAADGVFEPVHDLGEAVLRVGCNGIFRLVLGVIAEGTLSAPQRGYGIGAGDLWQHSVVAAVAAQVMARDQGDDENLAFTAALLHDVGKIVLSASLEGEYAAVVKQIEQSGRSFVETEKLLLGVEHAEAGGRLLVEWNFPEALSYAVRYHHEPCQATPHEKLAAYANLADLLAHFLGYGNGYEAFAVRSRRETLDILRVAPDQIEQFVVQTDTALKNTQWFRPDAL